MREYQSWYEGIHHFLNTSGIPDEWLELPGIGNVRDIITPDELWRVPLTEFVLKQQP